MDIQKSTLVSVIVVTYNSEQYIIETLESIKNQKVKLLELIISDDCSKDNTIKLCEEWIANNKTYFCNTRIITVPKNTGIPANCNRGIEASKGEWLKLIAGDDILMENCIEDNVIGTKEFPNDKIFISNMKAFSEINTNINDVWEPAGKDLCNSQSTATQQYQFLLKKYFGNSPTLFIKRDVFDVVKYDEEIMFMEDYPFALNVTKLGYKYIYIDKLTVGYRVGNSSFNSSSKIFNDFYKKEYAFKEKYIFPFAENRVIKYHKFEFQKKSLFEKLKLNNKGILNKILYRIMSYANPYQY